MPRLSLADWANIKLEYETTDIGVTALAKKYNVAKEVVFRRKKKEEWQRDIRGAIDTITQRKIAEIEADSLSQKVTKGHKKKVTKGHKKVIGMTFTEPTEIIDLFATKRAEKYQQHKEEWERIRQIVYKALETGTFDAQIRLAKMSAETIKIIQACERQAWDMDKFARLAESEREFKKKDEIITKCLSGEYDAVQAAAHFEFLGIPMPEFVKTVLARTPVPEPVIAEAEPISATILKSRFEAAQKKIEDQRAALPARREEIDQLKKQVEADSKHGQMGTVQGVAKGPGQEQEAEQESGNDTEEAEILPAPSEEEEMVA